MSARPAPSGARRVAANVLANQIGFVVPILVAFWLSPFVVRTLGDRLYGVWSLIAAFTGHYGLVAGGVQSATTRYIAFAVGHEDRTLLNRYVNSALRILVPAALLCVLVGVGVGLVVDRVFHIPPDLVHLARVCVILVSVTVAITIATAVFSCILIANQRFDALNAVSIGSLLMRTLFTVVLLLRGHGLLALAFLALSIAVVTGGGWAALARRVDRGWRITPALADSAAVRDLLSYGAKALVGIGGGLLMTQFDLLLVGMFLPPERVTIYSLASTILLYVVEFVSAFVHVMDPYATQRFAREGVDGIRAFFLESVQFLYALGGLLVGGAVLFARPFFGLWIGPGYLECGTLLSLLILPQLLNPGTRIGHSALVGMARIGAFNAAYLAAGVLRVVIAVILIRFFDLRGVATGAVIAMAAFDGLWFPIYMARLLRVAPAAIYLRAARAGLSVGAGTVAAGVVIRHLLPPLGWMTLFADVLVAAVAGAVVAWWVLPAEIVGLRWRERLLALVRQAWRAATGGAR